MQRRNVIFGGTAVLALAAGAVALRTSTAFGERTATGPFEVEMTPEEWQKKLDPKVYKVLREEYTEAPGSSPLNNEHRDGIFACAGCDLPLYDSETKYDSGTGWPSFYRPIENAVGESTDYKLGYPRTEVHCRRCGGHLGHVFTDGPQPTGLRYCMNGLAMVFHPAEAG